MLKNSQKEGFQALLPPEKDSENFQVWKKIMREKSTLSDENFTYCIEGGFLTFGINDHGEVVLINNNYPPDDPLRANDWTTHGDHSLIDDDRDAQTIIDISQEHEEYDEYPEKKKFDWTPVAILVAILIILFGVGLFISSQIESISASDTTTHASDSTSSEVESESSDEAYIAKCTEDEVVFPVNSVPTGKYDEDGKELHKVTFPSSTISPGDELCLEDHQIEALASVLVLLEDQETIFDPQTATFPENPYGRDLSDHPIIIQISTMYGSTIIRGLHDEDEGMAYRHWEQAIFDALIDWINRYMINPKDESLRHIYWPTDAIAMSESQAETAAEMDDNTQTEEVVVDTAVEESTSSSDEVPASSQSPTPTVDLAATQSAIYWETHSDVSRSVVTWEQVITCSEAAWGSTDERDQIWGDEIPHFEIKSKGNGNYMGYYISDFTSQDGHHYAFDIQRIDNIPAFIDGGRLLPGMVYCDGGASHSLIDTNAIGEKIWHYGIRDVTVWSVIFQPPTPTAAPTSTSAPDMPTSTPAPQCPVYEFADLFNSDIAFTFATSVDWGYGKFAYNASQGVWNTPDGKNCLIITNLPDQIYGYMGFEDPDNPNMLSTDYDNERMGTWNITNGTTISILQAYFFPDRQSEWEINRNRYAEGSPITIYISPVTEICIVDFNCP